MVILVALLNAFVLLSTDWDLPALPGMGAYFGVSADRINLALTASARSLAGMAQNLARGWRSSGWREKKGDKKVQGSGWFGREMSGQTG